MLKTAFTAALLLVCMIANAEARQRHRVEPCKETGSIINPVCGVKDNNPFSGARSISVTMRKVKARRVASVRHVYRPLSDTAVPVQRVATVSPAVGYSIARPMRYIGGRLICAINVNAALAERGIKGTGSALAHSFDGWGVRTSTPIPGRTVAVSDRRGGGHVALVSRVEGSRIWVWNATGGHHGWYEVEYTNRHARYRVAG